MLAYTAVHELSMTLRGSLTVCCVQPASATTENVGGSVVIMTHAYSDANKQPATVNPGLGPLGQHRLKQAATLGALDTSIVPDARPKSQPASIQLDHVQVGVPAAPQAHAAPLPSDMYVASTEAAVSALKCGNGPSTGGSASIAAAQPLAQAARAAASHGHQRGMSTASVYDVDDLDDEWKLLLDNVSGLAHTPAYIIAH